MIRSKLCSLFTVEGGYKLMFLLRLIDYLLEAGFYKEGEVSFPQKQSAVMKIKREFWEGPAL